MDLRVCMTYVGTVNAWTHLKNLKLWPSDDPQVTSEGLNRLHQFWTKPFAVCNLFFWPSIFSSHATGILFFWSVWTRTLQGLPVWCWWPPARVIFSYRWIQKKHSCATSILGGWVYPRYTLQFDTYISKDSRLKTIFWTWLIIYDIRG